MQALLALMILVSAVLRLALFALSLPRSVPDGRRRRLRLAVGPLPLAELGLYALYESGVSVCTDSRVDLLLGYPALFVALVS